MITTPTIHTSQHIPYAADASAQFLEDIGLRDGPPPFRTVAAVGGLAGVGCSATLVTKKLALDTSTSTYYIGEMDVDDGKSSRYEYEKKRTEQDNK